MCGICGIVGTREIDPSLVELMNAALTHRGPDAGSVTSLGRCVLGYRRLRVVDLVTGDQPVRNERGTVTAVFNGELYDFTLLRERLRRRGHTVPGTGDTPVIPHVYEDLGTRFPEALDGMFAIALWDQERERLVLARDRFGKKPLHYTTLPDGSLAFASELKALLRLPAVARELDLRALDSYLALQYIPGPATALRSVSKLPPGHVLVWEAGRTTVERYWQLQPSAETHSDEAWVALVRAEVSAAVKRRLTADVPLGALLSGGIDSSVVVAAMAEAAHGRIQTFAVGFDDSRYDERSFARLVAERVGADHHEIVVRPDATSMLPRLAAAYDEPFGDSSALPTYLVCEFARRSVTVALTGDGGDEVFAGYERYRAYQLAERLDRVPPPLRRLLVGAARSLPGGRQEPRSTPFRAARFLETAGLRPAERYGALMEIFPASVRGALWSDEHAAELGRLRSAGEILGPPQGGGLAGLQLLDLATYLPGDLLVKADIASMAHSLELRSPLLDHRLAAVALGLPDRLKASGRQGKVALRRAFSDVLPDEVLRRGKKGFGVPVARWFREDLRELAGDVLLGETTRARGLFHTTVVERLVADHVQGRADHGARLWALVMLELWCRHALDTPRELPTAFATEVA